MSKKFKLDDEKVARLIPSLGGCMVSDAVAVSGEGVGSMVRDEPVHEGDSGWIFTAGTESPEELNDPKGYTVFDVNTLANHSPEIIPFLLFPPGSEIRRSPEGRLTVLRGPEGPPPVQLLTAAQPGWLQVTRSWGFEVPSLLLRRIENGSQVLWRPGLTVWLDVYHDEEKKPAEERLAQIVGEISPAHQAREVVKEEDQVRLRYRLEEDRGDGVVQRACHCFGLTDQAELHLAIYSDAEELPEEAEVIWSSIRSSHSGQA